MNCGKKSVIECFYTTSLMDIETEKAYATRAAEELGYSEDVLERIRNASTPWEIDRAMVSGRHSR